MSYQDYLIKDQRLVILQTLAEQNDVCLGENLLQEMLDLHGHRLSIAAIRELMGFLEGNGAVKLSEIMGKQIATLTQKGLDHLDRRSFLEGVARPLLEG